MSPVSRKRKKARDKEKARRAANPRTKNIITPDYNPNPSPGVGGPQPPAEVELLSHISSVWQIQAKGQPANHCLYAVSSMQSVLADWGVQSEPVVVHATVDWPGLSVDVGSASPSMRSAQEWSGHMGLWIPSLGRFLDPTIYQANRPESPTRIDRAMVIPIHPRELGPYPFDTAFGATITYRCIDVSGQRILDDLPQRARAELSTNTANYRRDIELLLGQQFMLDLRRRLTMEPLATALAPR